jgi:hypothetical protein
MTEYVRMPDGTVIVANVKRGETLTDADKVAIAKWVQFYRDRKAVLLCDCKACQGTGHTENGFQDCEPCKGTGMVAKLQ